MMRGTFANIRIKNHMVRDEKGNVVEGGFTIHQPSGERMFIYDAAMRYQREGRELVVFAGKDYGMGSSRDWAAKGTLLLGVRAVVAESFERIHRSNLIGMGVLPLQFIEGGWKELGLTGDETVSLDGVSGLGPRQRVTLRIGRSNGRTDEVEVLCRIDTENEVEYFRNGGILHFVLRGLAKTA
jgi:aconitate hydratase